MFSYLFKFSVILLFSILVTYSQTYKDDSLVVRLILDINNKKAIEVSSVSNVSNGRITSLKFSGSNLGGSSLHTVPAEIGDLDSLKELTIVDAFLYKSLPDEIGRLSALEFLKLYDCKIEILPMSILNIKPTGFLDVGRNYLHLDSLNADIINWLDLYDNDWRYRQDKSIDGFNNHSIKTPIVSFQNLKEGDKWLYGNYNLDNQTSMHTWQYIEYEINRIEKKNDSLKLEVLERIKNANYEVVDINNHTLIYINDTTYHVPSMQVGCLFIGVGIDNFSGGLDINFDDYQRFISSEDTLYYRMNKQIGSYETFSTLFSTSTGGLYYGYDYFGIGGIGSRHRYSLISKNDSIINVDSIIDATFLDIYKVEKNEKKSVIRYQYSKNRDFLKFVRTLKTSENISITLYNLAGKQIIKTNDKQLFLNKVNKIPNGIYSVYLKLDNYPIRLKYSKF